MKQDNVLHLEKITTDGGTQARAGLNEDVVAEYAEAITAGAEMPPVIVYHDGKKHWLADGFHRYFAHVKARAAEIAVDVRTGTKRDAILYSVSANKDHGLRRTNADKRCAVKTLLGDKEWRAWSDREIAELCGVSHTFVAAIRNPKVAERQKADHKASVARASGNGLHAQQNNDLQAEKPENPRDDGYFPWSTSTAAKPSKPAEKPEPANEEGPTLSELVDELQRENETLRAERDALAGTMDETDLRAQLARTARMLSHAKREQGIAMDNAAKCQDREKFIVRMLRRCGKAVGIADPNHTDPRDIAKAVEAFAAGRSRHAA